MSKKILLAIIVLIFTYKLWSQKVIITDDNSYTGSSNNAILELFAKNFNKGFLIPRLTTAQKLAISLTSNDIGLTVYDTDTKTFWYYDGSDWSEIFSSYSPDEDWIISGSNLISAQTGIVYIGDSNHISVDRKYPKLEVNRGDSGIVAMFWAKSNQRFTINQSSTQEWRIYAYDAKDTVGIDLGVGGKGGNVLIKANGNVGIGTNNPLGKLHIAGNVIIQGSSPYADIRAFGAKCDGVTNDDAAIQAAISSGAKRIFLPANTFWIPSGNLIPGNVEYYGEDWKSVVISAQDPNNQWLAVGAGAILKNVSFKDKSADNQGSATPNDIRPVHFFANNRASSSVPAGSWMYQQTAISTGDPGIDRPGIGVNNYGIGDAFWAGVRDNGVGLRIDLNLWNTSKTGTGVYVINYGAGKALHLVGKSSSSGQLLSITQEANVPAISVFSSVPTNSDINLTSLSKTSGQMINLFHNNSNFSGTGLLMNFAYSSGSFTGKFFNFKNNNSEKAYITSSGRAYFADSVSIGTKNNKNHLLNVNGSVLATTYDTYSDLNLKYNIQPLDSALIYINKLKPVSFYFVRDNDINLPGGQHFGLIAQQTKQVLPQLVNSDAQGYQTINYTELIPVLIKAMQELYIKNQQLEKQLKDLKNK